MAERHVTIGMQAGWASWEVLRGTSETVGPLDVAWAGFIVNASELCTRLGLSASVSRSGLLATAWTRWGPALAEHVEGQFAGAIMERKTGTITCFQDYLGLHPLNIRLEDDRCDISTDLAEIATADADLDHGYTALYLANGIVDGPRTPFKGIVRLQAGHAATLGPGPERLRYHELRPLAVAGPARADPRDQAAHLHALMQASVQAYARGAKCLGCEVSGGLDSASVASLSASGARPRAFTRILTARNNPDIAWAKKIVGGLGLDYAVVDGDLHPPFSTRLDVRLAEPGDWAMNAAMSMAYRDRITRFGTDVLLTGQGGDAVFWGDTPGPHYLADDLTGLRFAKLIRGIRQLQSTPAHQRPARHWLTHYAIRPIRWHRRGQRVEGYLHDAPLPAWITADLIAETDVASARLRSPVARLPGIAQTAMSERIQAVVSAVTRHSFYPHYGVSVRHPLLHLPLVRFMLSTPADVVTGAWPDRHLHRAAMHRTAPAGIMDRRGKGGGGGRYLKALAANPDVVTSLAQDSLLVAEGCVDQQAWTAELHAAAAGRADNFSQFAAAVCYEIWLRQWRAG
ncbi:hypothetical protein KX928_19415 [Roseobacter sp. YSTF-M11]|uniref:asparagine synthase (glutamine-hydrolyzing) n=1 Tax=Roseobacter insulae TaxID=2859783 RepID=A0A9X1FZV2_9RHOB|nr:asparagine synthase-related protein [Roseobacter insulae]MBW4709958.1 hypothetical protein [Roseobacter insulae]